MRLSPPLQPRQGASSSPSPSTAPPTPTNKSILSLRTLTSSIRPATNFARQASSTSSTSSTSTSASSSATSTATSSSTSGPNKTVLIIAIAAVVGVLLLISLVFFLRRTRRAHANPKYVPTPFLKSLWEKWTPQKVHYRLPDTHDALEPHRGTALSSARPSVSFDATANPPSSTNANLSTTAAGVDRNTSVRSVMTLPAYNLSARENEQVLGRAGDRSGIDVVIEFPEGASVEEAHREAEMEALYQVRLARRRENEEREERRRLRREARERGDYVALREIQERAQASSTASGQRSVEELRAEHERVKKERQRAVSSVSYADLGVARHDGTRLRANSGEEEREGLLGDAASFGAVSDGGRGHRRDRSASSVLSVDTLGSDLPEPGLGGRSRASSRVERAESPLRPVDSASAYSGGRRASSTAEGRAGSSPELVEHEDADADNDGDGLPLHSPPGYENIDLDTPGAELGGADAPPDYSSPVVGRGEHGGFFPPLSQPSRLSQTSQPSTASTPSSPDPQDSTAGGERRASTQIGQLTADGSSAREGEGGGEGGAGVPRLLSLTLPSVPSIHVDGPSPARERESED